MGGAAHPSIAVFITKLVAWPLRLNKADYGELRVCEPRSTVFHVLRRTGIGRIDARASFSPLGRPVTASRTKRFCTVRRSTAATARQHGAHADPASASWLPEQTAAPCRFVAFAKYVTMLCAPSRLLPGHPWRYATRPCRRSSLALSRQPSLVILLTVARALACSGRASAPYHAAVDGYRWEGW